MSFRAPTAAALMLLGGCALASPQPAPRGADDWEVHRIADEAIDESSGLVRSRTHPGVFWTHNDSGDEPRFFAIDAGGRTLAAYGVENAGHVDWEDIAIDDAGNLYIADFGNNANQRRDLVVYRVPEPDPGAGSRSVRADRALRFRYADQQAYGPDGPMNFDAESLVWRAGALYILTKHRSDTRSKLYRLPAEPADQERELEPLQELELREQGGDRLDMTTAADVSADGGHLALLTYRALYLYTWSDASDDPLQEVKRIELDPRRTRQAESVAWDGPALIFGNEQRLLFRIPDPFARELDRYPPEGIPQRD